MTSDVTAVVEGITDTPFVERLCIFAGFSQPKSLVLDGKAAIDRELPSYAKSAANWPYVVFRDLDRDAACAPEWLAAHAPPHAGAFFSLRIAVRAVEAWFLADREAAAHALAVGVHKLPLKPDAETDPKQTLVNLARASKKRMVREAVVPDAGVPGKVGRGYTAWLIRAAEDWSVDRARTNSESLERAHRRIAELRAAWIRHRAPPHVP
jgi:hypothetical protein